MRSLFIQLSLLVASIATVNLIQSGNPLFFSVAAGVLAGCTLCFLLLLGDFSVHRYLEERRDALTSVEFAQDAPELDWLEDDLVDKDSTTSAREALAA
jgi:hypothetical protein